MSFQSLSMLRRQSVIGLLILLATLPMPVDHLRAWVARTVDQFASLVTGSVRWISRFSLHHAGTFKHRRRQWESELRGASYWRPTPTAASRRATFGSDSSVPGPGENEMLLETQSLSLEPYMRARMEAVKSYTAHLEIGDVMIGQSISRVVVSRHPQFQAGDIVSRGPDGVRCLCRTARMFASWTRTWSLRRRGFGCRVRRFRSLCRDA